MQISVSMKGCGFDLLESNLLQTSLIGLNPSTFSNTAICPFVVFQTLDRPITFGIGNQVIWSKFVTVMANIGCIFKFGNYSNNQMQLNHKDLLNLAIQSECNKHSSQQLLKLFSCHTIPAGLVNSMLDVLGDQSNFEHNLLQNVQIPAVGQVVMPTGGINFTNYPNLPF